MAPQHRSPATATTTFCSPARSLLGWGLSTIVEVPAPWVDHLDVVSAALRELRGEQHDNAAAGPGPVAFAALPFDRRRGARFLVPALVQRVSDETTTYYADEANLPPAEAVASPPGPTALDLRAVRPVADWCAAVGAARDRVAAGALAKVVLAREVRVHADAAFDVLGIAARLAAAYPQALRYCIDGFLGASPELLVGRAGDVVRARSRWPEPRRAPVTRTSTVAARRSCCCRRRIESSTRSRSTWSTRPCCRGAATSMRSRVRRWLRRDPCSISPRSSRVASVIRRRPCSIWSRRCTRHPPSAGGRGRRHWR